MLFQMKRHTWVIITLPPKRQATLFWSNGKAKSFHVRLTASPLYEPGWLIYLEHHQAAEWGSKNYRNLTWTT